MSYAIEQARLLEINNFIPVLVGDGRNALIEAHAIRFNTVIIDIETKENTSFDVLSYINLNSQATKVFFSYEDEIVLEKLGINEKNANRLGINKLLKKPYNLESITSYLNSTKEIEKEKKEITLEQKEELKSLDKNFSSTPILDYYSGNISIIDLYLKSAPNKYIKISNKGNYLSRSEVEKLHQSEEIEYLYFRTSDRTEYLDQLNSYLKKYLQISNPNQKEITSTTQTILDKYLDEISLKGINKETLDQGKKLTENFYNMMKKDEILNSYLKEFECGKAVDLSHVFLTAIFATVITTNTDWASNASLDYIIQGAILHDIGMLEIPTNICSKNIEDMTAEEIVQLRSHPGRGFNMLSNTALPQQVKQIVYQHHEWINGEGYPNRLSGMKIFPPAKIISFASDFSEYILKNNLSPKAGLIELLPQKNIITRYDSEVIKSFARALNGVRKK